MGADELSVTGDHSPAATASPPTANLRRIDTTRPNIARVYDYWLGGKDNFAADRDLAERALAACPEIAQSARDNRGFVRAAAQRAAQAGITQFLDLGCGLPTHPAVHEAARPVNRGARVAYVDNDPVVIVHSRALLSDSGLITVQADLTDPQAVLADRGLQQLIDLGQPVCAILAGVLHFLPAARAREVCAAWTSRLASGSWLAVSVGHFTDPDLLDRMIAMYTPAPFHNHGPADVARFLDGLDLGPPGIAEAGQWLAGVAGPPPGSRLYALCAVAIKR